MVTLQRPYWGKLLYGIDLAGLRPSGRSGARGFADAQAAAANCRHSQPATRLGPDQPYLHALRWFEASCCLRTRSSLFSHESRNEERHSTCRYHVAGRFAGFGTLNLPGLTFRRVTLTKAIMASIRSAIKLLRKDQTLPWSLDLASFQPSHQASRSEPRE